MEPACFKCSVETRMNVLVYGLTVNDVSILILIFIQPLFVSGHSAQTHTHTGETSVMIEVLHSHLTGQVGEHHDTVVGTFVCRRIAQGRHAVGKVEQLIHTFHACTGSSHRRRLRDGIDTHIVFASIDVTETACDRLQQCFGISHIIITIERALCSYIAQCKNGTVVGNRIQFLGGLYHLVERDGGNAPPASAFRSAPMKAG